MGRASALVFAREDALVVGCDLSVGATQATVELVRGAGGEMVSKQLRHLTEPADGQALVDLARGSSAGSTLFNLAATAYVNRLEDISDEERDRAPATRSTSSGGMKVW
jgi:meso-butanediol dehydrogenase / (S,S)-butanediol dehydrogenase / diacetyl reductase